MSTRRIFQLKSRPHGIERGKLFIDEGFVCIGWPGIGDLTNVGREEIRARLKHEYGYTGQQLGAYTGAVNRFVNDIQPEDVILVPIGVIVHIGIVGPYYYESKFDNEEGMCHRRKVTWTATVLKSKLNYDVIEFVKNRGIITKFSGMFEDAELDDFLTLDDDDDMPIIISNTRRVERNWFDDGTIERAKEVIISSLNSNDSEIRLKAAVEILRISQLES
ncbi:hypothetical protein [Exiguobacterium sp. s129]|uniref:hypothetical protein n=1 Tax=Exiguobacterium sp. s129 TaxID=2751264 RepID=UPI001BE7D910|nr:hypothetical protein [Exiguobacterium sp. s129]